MTFYFFESVFCGVFGIVLGGDCGYFGWVFGGVWEAFLWYFGRFLGAKHKGKCGTRLLMQLNKFMNIVIF